MCYNSNCSIELKSTIDGETCVFSAKGKVLKTPSGMQFDYCLDGDRCTLTVTDGEVVQTRRGEQNIKLTFKKCENTECVLDIGGFSGVVPVYTEDMQHNICSVNRRFGAVYVFILTIVYMFGEQKTKIDFSAKYTLREKI